MEKNHTYVLIRHGEKDAGSHLSADGKARSEALIEYLYENRPDGVPFPTHVVAMKQKSSTSSTRCVDTVLPFVYESRLPLFADITRDHVSKLVAHLKGLPRDAVVLVCWEHKKLVDIARELGAPVRNWSATPIAADFDTKAYDVLWLIRPNEFRSYNTFGVRDGIVTRPARILRESYERFA